jgi:hypothetical protein
MDDMSYQRRGDQNLLTLIKELKVTDPGNEQTDT